MARVVRLLDWAFIGFVLLDAAGHAAGSLATYPAGSEILVYALGMSVPALTCGTLNILRHSQARRQRRRVRRADGELGPGQCGTRVGVRDP